MNSSVPIPLPSEPPRDRVIEAVDADGKVVRRWAFGTGRLWMPETGWPMTWSQIAYTAYEDGFTLRHVPAETGEAQ